MLMCRSESSLSNEIRKKIALFASLPMEAIVSACDVDNIYKVPLTFRDQGVDDFILEHFGAEAPSLPDLTRWIEPIERSARASRTVRIALVGKYIQLEDAYLSVAEALRHAASLQESRVEIDWIDSEGLEAADNSEVVQRLADADGILIPGGFGGRGIEGKIAAAGVRAYEADPVSGDLPGHAGGGGRVRAQRGRHGGRQLDRVRHRDALPGDRPAARAEGGRRPRRHDAPGRRSDQAPRRHPRQGDVRRGGHLRAPPSPL